MRALPAPPLAGLLVAAALLVTAPGADARPRPRGGSDTARTLARMAERDGLLWPRWEVRRPLASRLPPLTRERVAAPPLTGWGYGGTVPGAWPGF